MDRVISAEVMGYQIRRGGETLGATGTGNAVLFQLRFDEAWDGMTKTAKFTDARGDGGVTTEEELLTQNADGSYTVAVPREAMAYEGTAELTLIGEIAENGVVVKRLTTKPLPLRIYASGADRQAQNTEPITATDKQQIMAKIDVAEAYAKGTVNGIAVSEGEAGYHDNAAYYRSLAEEAQTAAETAREAAEEARTAAETAQGNAESAQESADEAQESAGCAAEEACAASNEAAASAAAAAAAQTAIETAGTLIADLAAHRYDAFAEETKRNQELLYTDIAAGGIPLSQLKLSFHVDSECAAGLFSGFTLRRCGKNLLDCSGARADPNSDTRVYHGLTFTTTDNGFRIHGTVVDSFARTSLIGLAAYPIGIPIFEGITYSFSCGVTQIDGDLPAASLHPNNLLLRIRYTDDSYQDVANGGSITAPKSGYAELVTCSARLSFSNRESYDLRFTPQLEIGSSCSAFAPYSGTDYAIPLTGEGVPAAIGTIDLLTGIGENDLEDPIACTPLVLRTNKGINVFYVRRRSGSAEDVLELSATYRLDPTLTYEKLNAAIAAAGTE